MTGVIRMPSKDCKCTVDLFAEDDAGELVRQDHGAEGKKQTGLRALLVRPAVGGADGEDDPLAAFIALAAEPSRKLLGRELTAAGIEENQCCRRSRTLPAKRIEEGFGGFEDCGLDWRVGSGTAYVFGNQGIEVLAARATGNRREGDFHISQPKRSEGVLRRELVIRFS